MRGPHKKDDSIVRFVFGCPILRNCQLGALEDSPLGSCSGNTLLAQLPPIVIWAMIGSVFGALSTVGYLERQWVI